MILSELITGSKIGQYTVTDNDRIVGILELTSVEGSRELLLYGRQAQDFINNEFKIVK